MTRPAITHGVGRAPITHVLKCVSPYYEEVEGLRKVHELRKDDRDYQVGDQLHLRHYIPERDAYSGRSVLRAVTYIMRGPWPEMGDVNPLTVPCSKCGKLPVTEQAGVANQPGYISCPTVRCRQGSWDVSQWAGMNYVPAITKGWCIMSMRPLGTQVEPIAAAEALAVISCLVEAKDEKEARGETDVYRKLGVGLWDHARLLTKRNIDWLSRPMCSSCKGTGIGGPRPVPVSSAVVPRTGSFLCTVCGGTGRLRPPSGPTVGVST